MLSDLIRQMHERVRAGDPLDDRGSLLLSLRTMELEARNMEDRLQFVTGAPHAPLGGRLISAGAIVEIAGKAVRHAG